jgi:hypothetical protein
MQKNEQLEIGQTYKITYPIGESTIVKLARIDTYGYFPNDYIFEYISGDMALVKASVWASQNLFPLPEGLLSYLKIEKFI